MRSCVLAVGLAACSTDPTLHVTVVHPSTLTVASTTVSVYTSKMFMCQDIEYGNVDASALEAALVAQETIDASGTTGALAGLSRSDDKLIVARGYDMDGGLVAAGCADKGVVSGADKVEVDTVVAAVVSIALSDPTGMNDLYGIAVTTTEPSGKALDGRQVWWRVYGPAGTVPGGMPEALTMLNDGIWEPVQPTCTKKGLANIHPVPPGLIGGFAVEVRVGWAVDAPKMFSSFTKIVLALTPVSLPMGASARYCGRHGASLVCLDNSGSSLVASAYTAAVSDGAATLTKGAAQSVPPEAIAIYDLNGGTDTYAATSTCAVAPLYGASGAHAGTCTGADDILVVPACGSTSAKLLFHIPGGIMKDSLRAIDLGTGLAVPIPLAFSGAENRVGFNSSGCVTELDPAGGTPSLRQVIVLDFTVDQLVPVTRAIYNCPTCQVLPLPIALAGVGFTGGSESHMVVTTVDASGVELSQDVLLPDANGNADHLVERLREPAASVPLQLVAGNFDNDDGTDLLMDISSRRGTSFEVAYARMVGTQPLAALSPVQTGVSPGELLVGDVTNDSHDDIIVLGKTLEAIPKAGVAVVPTHVAPQNVTLQTDTSCAP